MSFQNQQPNDTAKNLDEIRKARLREAAKGRVETVDENDDTPAKPEENADEQKKTEKKLDNNQKNDYIDEDDNSEVDEEKQKLKNYINNTFDGDELKMAKSLLSSQSEYSKLYNKYQQVDKYKQLIDSDPKLKEAFEKAESTEDIKNLLSVQKKESQDKPKQPEQNQSKLNEPVNVGVDELIEKGYINNHFYNDLSEAEKQAVIRQAEMKYLQAELPNILAERTVAETRKRIDEIEQQRKQKETEETIETENIARYESGITQVVEKYGLDFAGNDEDKALLDEINRRAAYIRDPENPDVIDTDAVEIATRKVLAASGRLDKQIEKRKQEEEDLDKFKGDNFNTNKRQPRPSREPETVAEKLRQRRAEKYQQDLQRGTPKRKNEVIKIN